MANSSEEPTQRWTRQARETAPPQRSGCGCGGCLGRVLLLGLLLLMVFTGLGIVAISAVISSTLTAELQDDISRLEAARSGERATFETTVIMDRDGETLWEIYDEGKRSFVPFEQIPPALVEATISVEDDTFYTNKGFDEPSLIAAVINNLRNPDERPVGGSTITQQLVRHIAFDYEERVSVSYRRKLKELFLAWRMTQDFTKQEIIELYLNEIYYGNLAYGVEAAARTYFDKPAAQLTLAEAALLAGLPQSPVALDPYSNLEAARERQWFVLTLMVEDGVITLDQANAAYLEPLNFARQEVSLLAPHFAVYVRQQLETLFGAEQVAGGGLRVTTTLDLDMQRLAETLAQAQIAQLATSNVTNASLVAVKPDTGEIVAMLGSVDFRDETIDGQVNVALSPQQPGSTFKPITYAAALTPDPESGEPRWDPADIIWDVPVDFPLFDGTRYTPVNYDERYHGPLRMREALANSYNVPAVLIADEIGVPRVLELARRMGLASLSAEASDYGLSLTLGGADVTPLEMATAFGVFANRGVRVSPFSIARVTDSTGAVLYEHAQPAPERVLDERVAFLISDMLDDDRARIPAMGADNPLALPFPAAAKTGTTNDFRDNWTIGYTPSLVVTVWTGNTDNTPMNGVSGLTGAAPLWNAYMNAVYSDPALFERLTGGGAPPAFEPPAGLERVTLCTLRAVQPEAESCALDTREWQLQTETPRETQEPTLYFELVEPAVIRALTAPVETTWIAGDPPPVPFCRMTEAEWPEETRMRLFLLPPARQDHAEAAFEWASERNVPILPPACNDTTLAVAFDAELMALLAETLPEEGGPAGSGTGAYWKIVAPKEGEVVSGQVPIVGTVRFDERTSYYKVEARRLDRDTTVTLGDVHTQPVINGVLETLNADGLSELADWGPGTYELRLIVVGQDGNYLGEPDSVLIAIGQ